ncbi:hypothetical protein BD408DRAFT_402253 [Parasitella parasitica]|nr:hypothetical protein BD408DRAFT_402253 [Parasitella parasitica]
MATELRISVDEGDDDDDDRCSTTSSSSSCRNVALLRPHIVLPNPRHAENRKSLDIPNDWLLPNNSSPRMTGNGRNYYHTNGYKPSRNLSSSRPMVSTTFPSLSNSTPLRLDALPPSHYHHRLQPSSPPLQPASSPLRPQQYQQQQEPEQQQQQQQQHPQYHHHLPSVPSVSSVADIPKLGRSLSASTFRKKRSQQPPKVITVRDRISFDSIQRPASLYLDTRSLHSIEDGGEESEELMGDFLLNLGKLDGNVVGSFKPFKRI